MYTFFIILLLQKDIDLDFTTKVESPGIEPGTLRMQSGCDTTTPQSHIYNSFRENGNETLKSATEEPAIVNLQIFKGGVGHPRVISFVGAVGSA